MSSRRKKKPTNKNLVYIPKKLSAKTPGQQIYIDAMNTSVLTLCSAPAGAGKSWCAAGVAVEHLKRGLVDKIVVTRPAIECGHSKLGALPGDVGLKIFPYMAPILNALQEFLSEDELEQMQEDGTIQTHALSLMRGLSLNRAFIIGDELQNGTLTELKMLLTRLGHNSKMVLSGDIEQSDLYKRDYINNMNPLAYCMKELGGIDDISIVKMTSDDIVRHSLISKILERLNT